MSKVTDLLSLEDMIRGKIPANPRCNAAWLKLWNKKCAARWQIKNGKYHEVARNHELGIKPIQAL